MSEGFAFWHRRLSEPQDRRHEDGNGHMHGIASHSVWLKHSGWAEGSVGDVASFCQTVGAGGCRLGHLFLD